MDTILSQKLTLKDFNDLARFIYQHAGIKLPDIKKSIVEGRLRKRLQQLQINNFKDYTNFVLSQNGQQEVSHFIDALTTNTTHFFREQQHFDFLVEVLIPKLFEQGIGRSRALRVWSAACSSGEEPYSIAMLLAEWNEHHSPLNVDILATDISTTVLRKASKGVYREADVKPIPLKLRQKYLLRSLKNADTVKMSKPIRDMISFGKLNLQDTTYRLPNKLDIIFCRNVLIYFDRKTQQNIINQMCDALTPKGFLILGHSESINGLNVPLKMIGPTAYKKIKV